MYKVIFISSLGFWKFFFSIRWMVCKVLQNLAHKKNIMMPNNKVLIFYKNEKKKVTHNMVKSSIFKIMFKD